MHIKYKVQLSLDVEGIFWKRSKVRFPLDGYSKSVCRRLHTF